MQPRRLRDRFLHKRRRRYHSLGGASRIRIMRWARVHMSRGHQQAIDQVLGGASGPNVSQNDTEPQAGGGRRRLGQRACGSAARGDAFSALRAGA